MAARVSRALSRAVKSGDQLAIYRAMAAKLAAELETAGPRELAPLSGRLMDILEKLERLEAGAVDDKPEPEPEPTPQQKLADKAARKRGRSSD